MKAFVLMTAMPPTKGHLNLIRFASCLDVDQTIVIVCTQPHEPFVEQRFHAVSQAAESLDNVKVFHLRKPLEQNPKTPGFWEMWDGIMKSYGFKPGDVCVSSEAYGETLATRLKGTFIPYDPARELYYTKATNIREHFTDYFDDILPEFQQNLITRVTVFGAESVGKTTLSKALADAVRGHWIFEWARPYLELVGQDIDLHAMGTIWKGQDATQRHASLFKDKAFIIQDTDLFSTIGYWEQPHWQDKLGFVPDGLVKDARATQSDLYIILRSNIPFEPDPLRYGVDRRESDDVYWENVAIKYNLPYIIVDASDHDERMEWAVEATLAHGQEKAYQIAYDRNGL